MVDAHDPQRHPSKALLPRHPVRNRPHVDAREDRRPQVAAFEHGLARADRLIEPHVLIDGQQDSSVLAHPHDPARLRVIHAERLLGEDAANVVRLLHRFGDNLQLNIGRHRDIDDRNARVAQQLPVVVIDAADVVSRGHGLRVRPVARRDCDRIESRLAIRNEMAVGHDETRADAADRGGIVFGERGEMSQVEVDGG